MSAREIAEHLHISRRTVEYHVGAIMKRVNAENAVQAVSWCYAVGVLLPRSWPPRWSGRLCVSSADDLPEQRREHTAEPVEQDREQEHARTDADQVMQPGERPTEFEIAAHSQDGGLEPVSKWRR
jgi:hypothetical protein